MNTELARQIQAQGSLSPNDGMGLGPGVENEVRLPEDLEETNMLGVLGHTRFQQVNNTIFFWEPGNSPAFLKKGSWNI